MTVGRVLVADRYRLAATVGVGGMGRVWMAHDEMLDRDVAIKEFVPPDWLSDAERERLRIRTLREARSAARLNHPHVVRIYDVVHADDRPWIVMEYVPSRSLHQVIREDGPLSAVRAAEMGLAVLDALRAAHRAGVLHRDVKPQNVLIGHDGRIVLTDFGLATFVDDSSVTGGGQVIGSPQYVSPERAREGASTVESDLWSFGATLYAAVEGHPPYARESAMATLTALATEPLAPPVLAGPLAPLLTGLLRRDPAARITAADAEARLRRVIRRAGAPLPGAPLPGAALRGAPLPGAALRGAPLPGAAAAPAPSPPPDDRIRPPDDRIRPLDDRIRAVKMPLTVLPPTVEQHGPAAFAGGVGQRRVSARGIRGGLARFRLAVAGVVLVAFLAGGGAFLGWLGQRDDLRSAVPDPTTMSAPSPGPTTGETVGFSPVACAGAAPAGLPRTPLPGATRLLPGRYALPPQWSYYSDPAGFVVAVPDGWTFEQVGDVRCFREPGGARVLSVGSDRPSAGDPVAACRAEASRLLHADAVPGYVEIAVEPVPYVSGAADWEYRYEDPDGAMLHATTRWVESGDRAFALGWVTRQFDWQTNRPYLAMLQASFVTPAGRPA